MKYVGIVCQMRYEHGVRRNYIADDLATMLEEIGLIPLMIPVTALDQIATYLTRLDGLIFAGTQEVAPFYYGAEPTEQTGVLDLVQDQFELTLFKLAFGKLPILGLERGFQLINVALGGTLAPIESKIPHAGTIKRYHSVALRKNSLFSEMYGARLIVSSNHTMRIGELGNDLRGCAKSPDGVIEAYEHQTEPVIGVQFPVQDLSKELRSQLFQTFAQL